MCKPISLFVSLGACLAIGACDDDGPATSSGSGHVRIALTDAPGADIHSAVVVVSEVYLQGEDGRVVLRDDPITVDLVTLHNSTEILVDADVPDGRYSEIRLVIEEALIEVDGESGLEVYATPGFPYGDAEITGELKTPSWSSSGLKLKLRDGDLVVDGDQRFLVIDFDVAESFKHETGNGKWMMSPVVAVNDVVLTTAIEVHVALGIDVAIGGPIYIDLYDREGFFEGRLELVDGDGDGIHDATFVFVDPSEGPFSAELVTVDGLVLTTDPGVITIVGSSGQTVVTDIDVIVIVP